MTPIRLTTPGRLHFGLLARGASSPRQFGGLGLMVREPRIEIRAAPSDAWSVTGPLSARARDLVARLVEGGVAARPLAIEIVHAPAEHVGLGTGTQLSLGIAKIAAHFAGLDLSATELAAITGRGLRSGVGLHGFDHGGLIVEGGRGPDGGLAPLLVRSAFPAEWSVLVVAPSQRPGLHGPEEVRAFGGLPPMPESETDRLCRLVLLGILPAVVERDLRTFGQALSELQHHVGSWFAPAQGGVFASPRVAETVQWLRDQGMHGVGQSSWGPTVYAFSDEGPQRREAILQSLRDRFDTEGLWTTASDRGARMD